MTVWYRWVQDAGVQVSPRWSCHLIIYLSGLECTVIKQLLCHPHMHIHTRWFSDNPIVKIKVAEIPLWCQCRYALNHPLLFVLILMLLGLSFYIGLENSTVLLFSIYTWSLGNTTLDHHLISLNDLLK